MRRLLAVLLMLLGSSAAALGQIAVVASTSVLAGTSTPTINTTGATLLVAFCGYSGETISDTYGNTWVTPVTIGNGTVGLGEYSYSYSKSAGALSTGSADALSCGPATDSGTFIALSGTLTTSAVLDGTPVTAAGSSYPFTTGTFSPSQSGDMIVLELSAVMTMVDLELQLAASQPSSVRAERAGQLTLMTYALSRTWIRARLQCPPL